MNLGMYFTPEQPISSIEIRNEHLRILYEAVIDAEDFDVRNATVYEALDYLQDITSRTWGFSLYREGLERPDLIMMRLGFEHIQQHLGELEREKNKERKPWTQ